MGNGSVWNIVRRRSRTVGSATLEEVEVEATSVQWGTVYASGGLAVESVNINGCLEHVNVDGTGGTPGGRISFSGYEERS